MENLEEPTHLQRSARIPTEVGGYRLLTRLGAGGMGEVYKGQNAAGETMAIKLVRRASLDAAPGMEGRFNREAMISANIDHPAVVKVYDVGEIEHGLYMVMDFVDGRSLEQRIASGPVAVAEALDIAAQTAEALHAAHEMSVIHRDIKPANILLDRATGRVRLLDFGIARLVGDNQGLTRTGQLVGTPRYMSPEQVRGQSKDSDHRSDIWSTGVVLYEMLTGTQPFDGDNVFKLMDAIATVDPPAPSRLRGDVPPVVDKIVRKAMAKDQSMRHGSASALAAELRQAFVSLTGKPRAAPTKGEASTGSRRSDTAWPPRKGPTGRSRGGAQADPVRRGVPVPAIATGVAVLAIALGLFLVRGSGPGPDDGSPVAKVDPARPTPPPRPADSPRADPAALELARLTGLAETSEPAELARRIEAWRALARMSDAGPLGEKTAAGRLAVERHLESAAQAEYDRVKMGADACVAARRFDDALVEWDGFDRVLATGAWCERISEERNAIEVARHEASRPPTPTPDPVRVLNPAALMIPLPDGYNIASGGAGLEALYPDGSGWLAKDNVLTLACPEGAESRGGMLLHREATGLRRSIANSYIVFDLMLVQGEMEIRVLHPLDNRDVPVLNLGLNPKASPWMTLGQWYRMHFLYRDGTLSYGAEGVRVFDPVSGIKAAEGALMFIAHRGCELRVRPTSYYHALLGSPVGQR